MIPGKCSRSCSVGSALSFCATRCQSRRLKEKALEVGKVLKYVAWGGVKGAQTGWGGYDDWESKGQGGETGVRKRRSGGWFSVWDRLSLEGNQSSQGFRHTYMQTTTRRALTPLNPICLSFVLSFHLSYFLFNISFADSQRKHFSFLEAHAFNTKLAAQNFFFQTLCKDLQVKYSTLEEE